MVIQHRLLKRQILRGQIIFLLRDESESATGELRDINRSGAFFYTNVAVTMGSELLLLLLVRFNGATLPLFCAGEAVRKEEGRDTGYDYGVAMKFWQLQTPSAFMSSC